MASTIAKETSLLKLLFTFLCVTSTLSQQAGNASLNASPPLTTTKAATQQCDCYLVSGRDPGYFQHYQFWDFRDAPLPRQMPSESQTQNVSATEEADDSVFGSDARLPFHNTTFADDWKTMNWHRRSGPGKPVPIRNSIDNIFFAKDPPSGGRGETNGQSTYLVLRTTRLQDHSSSAELESRLTNIFRCSLRLRLRMLPYGNLAGADFTLNGNKKEHKGGNTKPNDEKPAITPGGPPKGACAGIFTYNPEGSESDIEILTKDPNNIIHYANQPDYDPETDETIPGASTIAAVPKPWTEWATHRLDWFSNVSVWYVDEHTVTSNTFQVPSIPSTLVLNLWSDGGDWTGNMRIGESVLMGIEWIQLAYNVSGPEQRPQDSAASPMQVTDANGQGKSADEVGLARKKKGKHDSTEGEQKCRRPCWVD